MTSTLFTFFKKVSLVCRCLFVHSEHCTAFPKFNFQVQFTFHWNKYIFRQIPIPSLYFKINIIRTSSLVCAKVSQRIGEG